MLQSQSHTPATLYHDSFASYPPLLHHRHSLPEQQQQQNSYSMNGGPIRRLRTQDSSASNSPYPSPSAPLRSSSFSDRSSSSETEADDLGMFAYQSQGHSPYNGADAGYGGGGMNGAGGLYAQSNRSGSALSLGLPDQSHHQHQHQAHQHQQQQMHQQQQQYGGGSQMTLNPAQFGRMSISHHHSNGSNPNLSSTIPSNNNPGGGGMMPGGGVMPGMAMAGMTGAMGGGNVDALEQLAANVRAATTTSASDRAKHIFVQAWLNANYAPYQDGNVPRQGLYNSYRRVCDEYRIPHVNTATLGKAIRLCFPAIKTRRLGVRGNSKYHYCGIRPSTTSEAEWLQDFINRTNNTRNTANTGTGGSRPNSQSGRSEDDSPDDDDDEGNESSHSSHLAHSTGPGGSHGLRPLNLRSTSSSGALGGRRSPVYFSMADDKTPTVGGFNTNGGPGAVPLVGSNGGAYATSLRRRGAAANVDGIVASNVAGYTSRPPGDASGVGGAGPGSFPQAQTGMGTLRPGESVKSLRGFPDIEEAIGGQVPPPLGTSSTSASPKDAASSSSPATSPDLSSSTAVGSTTSGTSASTAASPSSSSTSQFATTAREVWRWFEEHLDQLLEAVRSFRLDNYEALTRSFWGGLSGEHKEIVHAPAVAGLMARADALVYDEILEILRGQLLYTIPPQTLTGLRQMADKQEKLLLSSLEGYGNTFVEPKVELGARFGHLVMRFLDIYQVTQALASVMSNPKQLQDMSRSWREVDFESVRNQAALVCNCRHEDLHALLEVEFVAVLDGLQTSAEPVRDIIVWADQACDRLIGPAIGAAANGGGEERVQMSSRSLLIRWGYVTSQIMRDLTIRSDPAFGAFQILKLFMDDWIALNVLRNVALSINSVAASVEPNMQSQFLALSPSGAHFSSHPSSSAAHTGINSELMAHTPTTASMMAAMGVGSGVGIGMGDAYGHAHPAGSFGFDSYSFDAPGMNMGMNMGGMGMGSMGGMTSAFDFGAGAPQGATGGATDSEMSEGVDDIKVESNVP